MAEESIHIPPPAEAVFDFSHKLNLVRTSTLVLESGKMQAPWDDVVHDIHLTQGQKYIDIHFLPKFFEGQKPHLQEIRQDLSQVVSFLKEETQREEGALQAKYIIGITSQAIAELAKKYIGAQLSHEVPPAIAELMRWAFPQTPMAAIGRELGQPTICIWKVSDFIASAEAFLSR